MGFTFVEFREDVLDLSRVIDLIDLALHLPQVAEEEDNLLICVQPTEPHPCFPLMFDIFTRVFELHDRSECVGVSDESSLLPHYFPIADLECGTASARIGL